MRGVNSFRFKESKLSHRQQLKELQNQQATEIEKLKLTHQKFKNQLNVKHSLEANNIHSQHEIKMARQNQKNQETFDRMQKTLDDIKERTSKEKFDLIDNLDKKKELLKTDHEALAKAQKQKHQYMMQDLDHQASIELNRMQRKVNEDKTERNYNNHIEHTTQKENHKKVLGTDKKIFEQKRLAQDDKYQKALMAQRKTQNDLLVDEKRKSQKKISNTQKAFQKEFATLRNDHVTKKNMMAKQHEKEFQKSFKKNEYVLQNLVGKKEALLNRMRQMLKTEAKKEVIKNKDPFYQFNDLNPKYEINDKKDGYIITMNVPEHEAANVRLSGHHRQLKVTMDRNFDYEDQGYDGSKDSIKRVESYTSKIPVEYIVNPKTVERSYADGVLTYKIKFA